MTTNLSPNAPVVLHAYYRIISGGQAAYARGEELEPLLSRHLDFSGALAGHIQDATQGFIAGVSGFIATVERIEFLREVHDKGGSAVLYDAYMPGGSVRFAEFFTFSDRPQGGIGVIESLFLHFDGPDYVRKGGR